MNLIQRALAPAAVAQLVANPGTEHVLQTHGLLASLPSGFQQSVRRPENAAALFIALALDLSPDTRHRQLAFVLQQLARGELQPGHVAHGLGQAVAHEQGPPGPRLPQATHQVLVHRRGAQVEPLQGGQAALPEAAQAQQHAHVAGRRQQSPAILRGHVEEIRADHHQ